MPKHTSPTIAVAFTALFLVLPAMAMERREVPDFRVYGSPADVDATAAIDTLLIRFKDAWAGQDTEALMQLHADDVEWINAYARMFRGSEPLGDFLEHRLFPEFPPAVSQQESANMKPISIRYLGDDAAVLHLYTEGARGSSRNVGEEMRRTHLHLVLDRQNDAWKIVHVAIMDAR